MEEHTPSAGAGLVLDRTSATTIVWESDELSPTEGLVLLRLLACTAGARAETSSAALAHACKLDKRTLTRVLPRLREAGWFTLEVRGSQPSRFHWNPRGPLATAWVKPGPRAISAAPEIHDGANPPEIHDGANPLRYEEAALQYVRAEFSREIAAIEAARAEYSRTHPKVPPSVGKVPAVVETRNGTVFAAELVAELVVRIQVNHSIDVDAAARRIIGVWMQMEGQWNYRQQRGFLEIHGWDLRYLHGDVAPIQEKLWRAQPSRPSSQLEAAPADDSPALSREDLEAKTEAFLRAGGLR